MTNYDKNTEKYKILPKLFSRKCSPVMYSVSANTRQSRQISPFRHRYCALWASHLTGTEGCWEIFPFFQYLTAVLDNIGGKWHYHKNDTVFLFHSRRPWPFFPVLFCFVLFTCYRDDHGTGWGVQDDWQKTLILILSLGPPQTSRIGTLPHF